MDFKYDFAISYAGEEESIAQKLYEMLSEKQFHFNVFLASKRKDELIGLNGEDFFEKLFTEAKQVVVILSENYKRKDWPRYEWDIIRDRDMENRYIPIKVDNVRILGMPSSIVYLRFDGNYDEIVDVCVKKLLAYEKQMGIDRPSDLEVMTHRLRDSKGSLDKAFQLVADGRTRSPLAELKPIEGNFSPSYAIVEERDLNFSVIRRKEIRIDLPDNLSKEEVRYNLMCAGVEVFNKYKPDAICIFAYSSNAHNYLGFQQKFNVASADFAPFGDWGRAEEGFAYNLPIDKFDWKIDFEESYFNCKKKIETSDEIAERLVREMLEIKKKDK